MEWKEIPGLQGYFINKTGDVVDRNHKPVRTHIDSKGYMAVTQVNRIRIHRAVLLAFEPENIKPLVRHLDGNKLNNNINNLKWGTPRENIADSIQHGTHVVSQNIVKKGEKHPISKLTDNDVFAIRLRAKTEKLVDIAKDYPVDVSAIGKIIRRVNWAHI